MSPQVFSCDQLTHYTLDITTPGLKALWSPSSQVCHGPCWHLAGGREVTTRASLLLSLCVFFGSTSQSPGIKVSKSIIIFPCNSKSSSPFFSLSLIHSTHTLNLPTHLQTKILYLGVFRGRTQVKIPRLFPMLPIIVTAALSVGWALVP